MVSAEAVERLAIRPPTPPKDHDHDQDQDQELDLDSDLDHGLDQAIQFLDTEIESPARSSDPPVPAVETPAQPSPPSSQDHGSNLKSTRRVEFSPCVTAHGPQPTNAVASPVPRRFPSSKQPRPIRSILKATLDLQTPTPDSAASPATDYFSISDPKTFPIMLESVVKLLASPSTALRLDGYTTLNGALKAYEELPDAEALRSKIPFLAPFMTRDISESTQKAGPIEANLTTQALKLATAILMSPALEDSLDERFRTILVDRSIEVLEQDPVPKAIANHHMYLLATQRFSSRIVTPTKAERIVASLITIHDRVSGNSVVASRLVIFQRLIEQASSVMLSTIRDWIPHIFHGVLSSIKDIRGRALDTGNQAAMTLGTHFQATRTIIDLFNTSTSEDGEYGSYFIARLGDMTAQKSLAESVPQIWSMVILFFKSRKHRLVKWHLFKSFLLVIQKCLNSNDIGIKFRATCAWNRLIYVLDPDRETFQSSPSLINMLRVPFVVAFENKKTHDKSAKEARQIALTGYCNLLHYVLRPSQTHEDLDFFWDEYVHNVLSKLLRSGGRDASMACRVLKALFDSKSTVWDENVAHKAPMLPESLPRLDPRWVRSRTKRILDLLAPFLALSLSQPGDGRGIASTPWREFMTAIAGAGSQEVRVSIELKECLAHLMNFFGRLWTEASKNFKVQSDGMWITRFASLVQCSIELMGPLHFGEANLIRNKTQELEAVPTPSHRTSKHHDVFQSSAVVLYGLFSEPPVSITPDADYFEVAKTILHQIIQGRPSRRLRLDLVRQCVQAISSSKSARLWVIATQEAIEILLDLTLDETTQESQRLSNQIRDSVKILVLGLHHDSGEVDTIPAAFELISVMAKMLKQEAGDAAVALGLMEPVAEALSKQLDQSVLNRILIQCATKLFQEGAVPRTRQQIDEARRLFGNSNLQQIKNASADPFNHVYELIKTTLSVAYENMDECALYLADFSEAVRGFLSKYPLPQVGAVLRRMQLEIARVVKDDDRVLAAKNKNTHQASLKILGLWQTILDLLKRIPSNSMLLKALDPLFTAGLNSSHRAIVNTTVSFWNDTFGRLDSLEYPAGVELALRRLRPLVELDLPSFPKRTGEDEPSPLKGLMESQEVVDFDEAPTPTRQLAFKRPQKLDASTKKAPVSVRGRTSVGRKAPVSKSASKAKLRHDDSQVEFTAVESSSPMADMGSQLLTEHQKEVNSRQRFETAPMYPDFSSSPAPRSTGSALAVPKLDFSKQGITENRYATPTLEDHGPMDDYVTSSPTPKASKFQAPGPSKITKEQEPQSDVDETDIPSSPPQVADETGYEYSGDDQNQQPAESLADIETVPDTVMGEQEVTETEMATIDEDQMEFLSASAAPNTQEPVSPGQQETRPDAQSKQTEATHLRAHTTFKHLRQENEGGTSSDVYQDARSELEDTTKDDEQAMEEDNIKETTDNEKTEQVNDSVSSNNSSPLHFTDSFSEQQPSGHSFVEETTVGIELEDAPMEGDFSRVEDSFAGLMSVEDVTDVNSPVENSTPRREKQVSLHSEGNQEHSSGSRLKRKRNDEDEKQTPAKRRKSKSPFKRIISMVWPRKEESELEEDIEDCIIVGSQTEHEPIPTPEKLQEASAPASAAKLKRGRGRPKRSDTPPTAITDSPASSAKTRGAKRRASALEDDNISLSQMSIVADTPAPSKSRRMTRSQDAKSGRTPEHIELPRTRRQRARKLDAVVIPASVSKVREDSQSVSVQSQEEVEAEDEDVSQEAELQLRQEQEVAVARTRVIAKPKSIIERLKNIITECKSMVMGPQEERAVQDVLFELGREVFEARKRSGQ